MISRSTITVLALLGALADAAPAVKPDVNKKEAFIARQDRTTFLSGFTLGSGPVPTQAAAPGRTTTSINRPPGRTTISIEQTITPDGNKKKVAGRQTNSRVTFLSGFTLGSNPVPTQAPEPGRSTTSISKPATRSTITTAVTVSVDGQVAAKPTTSSTATAPPPPSKPTTSTTLVVPPPAKPTSSLSVTPFKPTTSAVAPPTPTNPANESGSSDDDDDDGQDVIAGDDGDANDDGNEDDEDIGDDREDERDDGDDDDDEEEGIEDDGDGED